MLFKPHSIQVQALRIAKRFQRGFKPTKVAGKPLAPNSLLSKIKFDSVPEFVLSAEIGPSPEYGDLIDELCQRGYFVKHDGYPECRNAPIEYVTEHGTRVYVRDKHWGRIDVLLHNAGTIRTQIGGFSGKVCFGRAAAPSHRRRRPQIVGKGSCYELTPKGFDLLDRVDAGSVIDPPKPDIGGREGGPTTELESVDPSEAVDKKEHRESRAKRGDWNALTDRQRNCMRALRELKAFDADSRRDTKEIAARTEGLGSNVDGFKRPLSELVHRELLESKTGPKGGYWLTRFGRALLSVADTDPATDHLST